MEVKKRQIIVEEEVYIAFDGTEFKTELQCDRYESELRRQEDMLSIAKLEVNWRNFGFDIEFKER